MSLREKRKYRGSLGLELATTSTADPSSTQGNDTSKPPTASRPSRLLQELAKSCNEHHAWHKKNSSDKMTYETEEELPKYCGRTVAMLRKLLPKVEKLHQVATTTSGQQSGPSPLDVRHICDFYSNVIAGGFCVHAPHLFQRGKGATDVIPRVLFLIEHALSPSVIAHSHWEAKHEQSDIVLDSIAQTIARLLNLVPGLQFEMAVLLDLIQMIQDLCFLLDQDLVGSDSTEEVSMALFPLTRDKSDIKDKGETLVEFASRESALVLQSMLLSTLNQYLIFRRNQRLYPSDDCAELFTTGFEQSNHYFAVVAGDPESITDLVDSLQQIIGSLSLERDSATKLHSKRAALFAMQVSGLLLSDCEKEFLLQKYVASSLSCVAVKATANYLLLQNKPKSNRDQNLSLRLAKLLGRVTTLANSLHGSSPDKTFLFESIQQSLLPHLMECIRLANMDQGKGGWVDKSLFASVLELLYTLLTVNSDRYSLKAIAPLPFSLNAIKDSDIVVENIFRAVRDLDLNALALPLVLSMTNADLSYLFQQVLFHCQSMFPGDVCTAVPMYESDQDTASTSLKRKSPTNNSCASAKVNETLNGKRQKTHDENNGYSCPFQACFSNFFRQVSGIVSLGMVEESDQSNILAVASCLQILVFFAAESSESSKQKFIPAISAFSKLLVLQGPTFNDAVPVILKCASFSRRCIVETDKELVISLDKLIATCIEHVASDPKTCCASLFDESSFVDCNVFPSIFSNSRYHDLRERLILKHMGSNGQMNDTLQTLRSATLADAIGTRVLAWASIAHIFQQVNGKKEIYNFMRSTMTKTGGESREQTTPAHFLVEAAFGEQHDRFRDFASRSIGSSLLAGEPCALLISFAGSDTDVAAILNQKTGFSVDRARAVQTSTIKFFQMVDLLLHKYCSVPQSQLSLPDDLVIRESWGQGHVNQETHLFNRKAAVRSLASICAACDVSNEDEKHIFKGALLRIVWLLSSQQDRNMFETMGLSFGGILWLLQRLDSRSALQTRLLTFCAPSLFRDIVLPNAQASEEMSQHLINRQYWLLFNLLEKFAWHTAFDIKNKDHVSLTSSTTMVGEALEDCLPAILAQLTLEKEMEALRLTAGFKLFHLALAKVREVDSKDHLLLPHLETSDRLLQKQKRRSWKKGLDRELSLLARAPGIVEQMLPLVLRSATRADLLFLLQDVFQTEKQLGVHISGRDQLVLKCLVKELGRTKNPHPPLRALKLAAMARKSPSDQIFSISDQSAKEAEATSSWISSRFMYLLVNVVQSRWVTKETWEKAENLRSLFHVLDFLVPDKKVAQYFPQMMATINGAIAHGKYRKLSQRSSLELRLLAVQCMAKFLRLVGIANWETIGENLALIIVSLLPVMTGAEKNEQETHQNATTDSEIVKAVQEIAEVASSIVEFLTMGDLGSNLVPSFINISFLFQFPELEKVKLKLQNQGVICDPDANGSFRFSAQSESESTSLDSGSMHADTSQQFSLRMSLQTMTGLLSHEDAGVRHAVMKHVIQLLRTNRDTFHTLVESESGTSMNGVLTVSHDKAKNRRGTVTELLEALLARCAQESDQEPRLLLATVLGEVGAIAEYRLNDIIMPSGLDDYSGNDSHVWRLRMPPWKAKPNEYGLQLLLGSLVWSLRAAPTSSDQNKIGYAIQQILVLLQDASTGNKKGPMEESISQKLEENGVLELVEPFWHSEFHEQSDGHVYRKPPFFQSSSSYLSWISNWCRHMITRSKNSNISGGWSNIFFACRTAVRTQVSAVAEFLLPILVLERLCSSDAEEGKAATQEMVDVLNLQQKDVCMSSGDLQKAVNAVFTIVDTFQFWLERDAEESFRRSLADSENEKEWLVDKSTALMHMEDALKRVSFELQATAAEMVGMNARSLRLFEIASRKTVAGSLFGMGGMDHVTFHRSLLAVRSSAAGICPHGYIDRMKSVLASLDDNETLMCLPNGDSGLSTSAKIADSIREKIAAQDWSVALQEHERALGLESDIDSTTYHHEGMLQCLLELGQHESVLNQVRGVTVTEKDSSYSSKLTPYAIQAAWRLGQWETLSSLVNEEKSDELIGPEGKFQTSLGKTFLSMERGSQSTFVDHVKAARCAVMDQLALASRDSYARSYTQIVKLSCLQEIEEFFGSFSDGKLPAIIGEEVTESWSRRLETAALESADVLINTRLAIARLAGDSSLEGRLFLDVGQRARKRKQHSIAASAFSKADEAFARSEWSKIQVTDASILLLERAKLKHSIGESSAALNILDLGDLETMSQLTSADARIESIRRVATIVGAKENEIDRDGAVRVFVRSALKSLKWTIDGGLKGGNEILSGFRVIHNLAPDWEKGHFRFAKYVESVMHSRVTLLQRRTSVNAFSGTDSQAWNQIMMSDYTCQKFLVLAVEHYAEALKLDLRHLYQALPRLLSLWFQFTSLSPKEIPVLSAPSQAGAEDLRKKLERQLQEKQFRLNEIAGTSYLKIPAQAFYSTIAQLIARITHRHHDTRNLVTRILKQVLKKFPEQAMWHLGWLLHSKAKARQEIGDNIFQDVISHLKNKKMQELLSASKGLISFLYHLATHSPKDKNSQHVVMKPWQGEVPLTAFLPPVQSALSLTPSNFTSAQSSSVFPRQVPRMRTFSRKVRMMMSKARPKRLTAYVVGGEAPWGDYEKSSHRCACDIGEIHFLVKQEARGDLRKDARVQDLNTVINRLLMTSNSTTRTTSSRRTLRLRTFAVTCLSEDTGLLEWLPNTNTMRNLISDSYNPLAATVSNKRRGRRMANPGDPTIRSNFEKKCQELFFVDGNLKRAAAMFEELCLKPHPPLLYWWFVQNFSNPHVWYEARTRFTQSAAAWSAVGHVIGLGDRHTENMLVDTKSGEVCHIDFDCLFDKGLNLPKPEIIPFRLTSNMVDAFGPTGAHGIYTGSLKDSMSTLRLNRDTLLSVLEPFLNDPCIDWKRTRSSQQTTKRGRGAEPQDGLREAKRSLNVIEERLRGIYNVRNPNFKKVRRTDVESQEQDDDELTRVMPLSVEGQVQKLIAEATSLENLVQLYFGWMPWV